MKTLTQNPQFAQIFTQLKKAGMGSIGQAATDMVNNAQQKAAEQPQKKGLLATIAQAGTKILGKVLPAAASLIPGVGPVIGNVLSTLNDDEWFSEFKGNGAAFNEWMQIMAELTEYSADNFSVKIPRATAALAMIPTDISEGETFTANFMPSVLAYVRKKTNNVLVDDTTLYTKAFSSAAKLLEVYYSGKKLLTLSENQPLNIPNIPGLIKVISPENYAAFGGVIKSLGEFISGTIRLPYALTEYIRWRFGTTFESANTGKPGLIMYSPKGLTVDKTVSDWITIIEQLKADYIACGRAGADLKLAYDDHEQRLTVEDRHYDDKEFNLRCNFTPGQLSGFAVADSGVTLLLDSRLDMNAAIQAVTISTNDVVAAQNPIYTPFITGAPYISYYVDKTSLDGIRKFFQGAGVQSHLVIKNYGWNSIQWTPTYNDAFTCGADGLGETEEAAFATEDQGYTPPESLVAYFNDSLVLALATSLEMHNRPNYYIMGYGDPGVGGPHAVGDCQKLLTLASTPLSYDTAVISLESLSAIQRSAIRNLVRGEYKRKTAEGTKPEVKAEVKKVVEAVQEMAPADNMLAAPTATKV